MARIATCVSLGLGFAGACGATVDVSDPDDAPPDIVARCPPAALYDGYLSEHEAITVVDVGELELVLELNDTDVADRLAFVDYENVLGEVEDLPMKLGHDYFDGIGLYVRVSAIDASSAKFCIRRLGGSH